MRYNIWPVLQVLIGIAGLSWGIYQHTQRQYEKEIHAASIVQKIQQVYNLQKQIDAHNKQNELYAIQLDSLQKASESNRKMAVFWRGEAGKGKSEIDNLKQQLNETPHIIDIDDSDHLDMFLKWTSGR